MKKLIFGLALTVSVSACSYSDIEIKGVTGVTDSQFSKEKINATIGIEIDNPNKFKISIKPSILDLSINGVYLGKIKLVEKVKLQKKEITHVNSPFEVILEKGILLKMAAIAMKSTSGNITINVKGEIKGSVAGFGKKKHVDYTKDLSVKDLKLDGLKLPF